MKGITHKLSSMKDLGSKIKEVKIYHQFYDVSMVGDQDLTGRKKKVKNMTVNRRIK